MLPKVLCPLVPDSFKEQLLAIDHKLRAGFNPQSEKWEIYRIDRKGHLQWILEVSNEDGSYRHLDNRTLKKLREMDIIARWGSIMAYEKHLDEKYEQWHLKEKMKLDHELKCDMKDDKILWDRAVENAKSGVLNAPPEETDKKTFSYRK